MINLLSNIINSAYADDVVGNILAPSGVPQQPAQTGPFISGLVRLMLVIAGLFTFWQFLSGGLSYITSNGDKNKIAEAQNKIQMAIVGLIIMAASFVIIGIISMILFGKFDAVLSPKLTPIVAP